MNNVFLLCEKDDYIWCDTFEVFFNLLICEVHRQIDFDILLHLNHLSWYLTASSNIIRYNIFSKNLHKKLIPYVYLKFWTIFFENSNKINCIDVVLRMNDHNFSIV